MSRQLTAADITLTWLESATLEDLKSAMRVGGDVLAAANALLVTPEGKQIASEMLNDPDYVPKARRTVSPEEAAAIAADEARANAQAAEDERARAGESTLAGEGVAALAPPAVDYAAYVAEDAEYEKIGVKVSRDASGVIEKIVVDYQVRGEDGHAIGRATHFEGRSWAEIAAKLIAAHTNAVLYSERVKANRSKQAIAAANAEQKTNAARAAKDETARLLEAAASEKDPDKLKEAIAKVVAAEEAAKQADAEARKEGANVAALWMADHQHDFYPCTASSNIIKDYMVANSLTMTYENLEKAFQEVKDKLPKVERQQATEVTTSVAPVNNPPAATTQANAAQPASIPPTEAAATVTQPTVQTQAVAPPAVASQAPNATSAAPTNSAPAARRPGVNGGLQPGTMSAARPSQVVQPTPAETRSVLLREINRMSRDEYRRKLRDVNYVKKLEAAGIPVVGQRG